MKEIDANPFLYMINPDGKSETFMVNPRRKRRAKARRRVKVSHNVSRRRSKKSKISRVMKRAAQLRKGGASAKEALKQAWAGNPKGGTEKMAKRRRSRRSHAARRARRNPLAALALNRRKHKRHARRNPAVSMAGAKSLLPSIAQVGSFAAGTAVSRLATLAAAKAVPALGSGYMRLIPKAVAGVGGGLLVAKVTKSRENGKFFLMGALADAIIEGVAMLTGSAMHGLSDSQYPELGLYTERSQSNMGLYTERGEMGATY